MPNFLKTLFLRNLHAKLGFLILKEIGLTTLPNKIIFQSGSRRTGLDK